MKKYFENIMAALKDFAKKKAAAAAEKQKITGSEDISQLGKDQKRAEIDLSLKQYGMKLMQKVSEDLDSIVKEIEKKAATCDLSALSSLFSYITITGTRCNVNILERTIKPYVGNMSALQALSDALENSQAPEECKKLVRDLIFDYNREADIAKYECNLVFTSGSSASVEAKKLASFAGRLGVEIVPDVTDEVADNEMLNMAFGLI